VLLIAVCNRCSCLKRMLLPRGKMVLSVSPGLSGSKLMTPRGPAHRMRPSTERIRYRAGTIFQGNPFPVEKVLFRALTCVVHEVDLGPCQGRSRIDQSRDGRKYCPIADCCDWSTTSVGEIVRQLKTHSHRDNRTEPMR